MARFRNRIVKAEFWTDGELLRWPLAKRVLYQGLWAIAEDSGCIEDDPFQWKLQLFPSPLDHEITVELLGSWRDELIAAGKLVPYEACGKAYFFIAKFHDHEKPRNPQGPGLPLPPWVSCVGSEGVSSDGKRWAKCRYVIHSDEGPSQQSIHTESVQTLSGSRNGSPALSCPVQSCREEQLSTADAADDLFEEFWSTYPRKEAKKPARSSWSRLSRADKLAAIAAAASMADCVSRGWREKTYCPMPSTFLNQRRWEDWAEGVPTGYAPEEGIGPVAAQSSIPATPRCPDCGVDLTFDEEGEHCPVCGQRPAMRTGAA